MTETRNNHFFYSMDDILRLVIQDVNTREGTNYTRDDLYIMINPSGSIDVSVRTEDMPPVFEATTRDDIRRLIRWAFERNRVIEFVYEKRTRGFIPQKTARIGLIYGLDDRYMKTHCYATMRNGVLEYSDPSDTKRTFLVDNILKVRLSDLVTP